MRSSVVLAVSWGLLAAVSAAQQPPSDPTPNLPRVEPMPIPRSPVLRRGDRPIVIDGSLQDWPGLPSLRLDDARQLSGSALGAFRGRGDIAGRVFLMWDAESLYLGAQVQDDWHVRLDRDSPRLSEIPPADALVVTFDPARDTRAIGPDPGRADDAEFWIAEVEGQGRNVVRWDRYRGTARFANASLAVVAREEDARVTTYEARLSWSEILAFGREPKARDVIDLQVVLSDYDEPTDPMPQTRIGWTFGMGTRIDPGLLGSVVLLEIEADRIGDRVDLPEIAPPPDPEEPAVPDRPYWAKLLKRLHATRPQSTGTADTEDPASAGGAERRDVLLELDEHLARFPRVDYLELQLRIHRRMNREAAGFAARGLPFFWDYALEELARRVPAEPPEHGFRIFRIPQGGYLVRSAGANFAIDPCGYRIEKELFGAIDFVLLTAPMDVTRRNDQLTLRLAAASPKRPVFTQLAMHLPGIAAAEIPLVVPQRTYNPQGLDVKVLGEVDEQGYVSQSVGYQVSWPGGGVLVVAGSTLKEEQVDTQKPIDLLLLSAAHPNAKAVAHRLRARKTVLTDVLRCAALPGKDGRVSIEQAWDLQREIGPHASVLIGPAEALDVRWGH